jgi:hypothetical protein
MNETYGAVIGTTEPFIFKWGMLGSAKLFKKNGAQQSAASKTRAGQGDFEILKQTIDGVSGYAIRKVVTQPIT